MAAIRLENVSFRYPGADSDTLSDLNLTIEHGEAHALLGASGAGKTTLLNLLSGLLVPTQGQIYFGEKDVTQLSGQQRQVAQVFQFPVLYESLTVAENLAFPLKTRGASRAQIDERLAYICAELELEDVRQTRSAKLNLFQKQLVAVGKALMRPDTALVLLDEPLTAVEPRVKWRLRQTLRRAQADLGVTMIYVTHDQTEALTFADRVSILTVDGILQSDTPEQIYSVPQHEFVGHFVGSPGMNFLPASLFSLEGVQRIGFRPEWAHLVTSADQDGRTLLPGKVAAVRLQGTKSSEPFGIISVDTEYGYINVRGGIDIEALEVGMPASVCVQRYVSFDNQLKVGAGEFF